MAASPPSHEKPPFKFPELTPRTRQWMIEEVDLTSERDHPKPRTLTPLGEKRWPKAWPAFLKTAIQSHDEKWLAETLLSEGLFTTLTDAERVADQHYKRFYIAAICRKAIDAGRSEVWAYRARESDKPRLNSEQLLGTSCDPQTLLEDMRSIDRFHKTAFGAFGSGLAVTTKKPSQPQRPISTPHRKRSLDSRRTKTPSGSRPLTLACSRHPGRTPHSRNALRPLHISTLTYALIRHDARPVHF